MEKREIPYIVSTNANWLQPLWRTVWGFLKKLTIELSYDPAIPVLGIYMQMKTLIWKDTCTSVSMAALLTTAKIWKQPKGALTEEWIKKVWCARVCVHTTEYHSAIKKIEIKPSAATWMDLEMIIWSEVSQRKTNTTRYHLDVESKKVI